MVQIHVMHHHVIHTSTLHTHAHMDILARFGKFYNDIYQLLFFNLVIFLNILYITVEKVPLTVYWPQTPCSPTTAVDTSVVCQTYST